MVKQPPVRRRQTAGTAPTVNQFYIDLSKGCRKAKFITVLLLCLYLIIMIITKRDVITVENFRYLMKYLDIDATVYSYSSANRRVNYDADSQTQFGLYRGDMVAVNSNSVNIYSLSGSTVLSESSLLTNPELLTNNKNMLVYDLGGTSYAFYNTFSKLHEESLSYPITNAAVSESGMYAIVSRTNEYRSAVHVYDKNYEMISQILKDKLVMDVKLNARGDEILVVSMFNNTGGEFCTEIMAANPRSDSESFLVTMTDLIPIRATYHDDGGFTVVCDTTVLFYDKNKELTGQYSYQGLVPVTFACENGLTILAFNKNIVGDEHNIVALDEKGECVFDGTLYGQIVTMACDGTYVYVLSSGSLSRIELSSGGVSSCQIEKNCIDLICINENTLFVCYPATAVSIDTAEAFKDADVQRPSETEPETTAIDTTAPPPPDTADEPTNETE